MTCEFINDGSTWRCTRCGRSVAAAKRPVATCGSVVTCPHLGQLLRVADAVSCGCSAVPIHECELHECETALRMCREGRTLWKGRDCLTCRAEGENVVSPAFDQGPLQVSLGYA